jgi:hypothetical protein
MIDKDTTPEFSEAVKKFVGKPQYNQSVFYTYNEKQNLFYFYTPVGDGREIAPIGMFSTINTDSIPYDPAELVDTIADTMSRAERMFSIE